MKKKTSKDYHRYDKNALRLGFRSGLELQVSKELDELGVPYEYESKVIKYVKPASTHRYTPDFILTKKDGTKMIIETKGRFVSADRIKHRLIKEQHPDLDIRFVFSRANQKLSKTSKTTYAMWADRYDFKWSEKEIPKEWLDETREH
jgi:hypothetical protein